MPSCLCPSGWKLPGALPHPEAGLEGYAASGGVPRSTHGVGPWGLQIITSRNCSRWTHVLWNRLPQPMRGWLGLGDGSEEEAPSKIRCAEGAASPYGSSAQFHMVTMWFSMFFNQLRPLVEEVHMLRSSDAWNKTSCAMYILPWPYHTTSSCNIMRQLR